VDVKDFSLPAKNIGAQALTPFPPSDWSKRCFPH